MSTHFKDLEFSFFENLILLHLKFFKLSKDKLHNKLQYHFLLKYSLVDYCDNTHTYVTLSDKGHMYLRFKRKDNFRFWFPTILSIAALFAGYDVYTIPLLEQLLQAVETLMKTILEGLGAFF